MSSIISYGDFTQEDAQKAFEEKQNNGGNAKTKFFKPKEGYTKIRIIPPQLGKPLRNIRYQHTVDVPGVGTVFFNCPEKAEVRHCGVCAEVKKLFDTKKEVDKERAKNLNAKYRSLFNIIVRDQEDEGPMVYEMGSELENKLLKLRSVDDWDFINPLVGVDLMVERTGKGKFDTKYNITVADKGRGRPLVDGGEDAIRMIIETQPDLSRFTRIPSDEEIQELLTTGKRSPRRESGGDEPRLGRGRTIQDDMDE